ncbi:efflux RND transporter periplasmic adaptor subunit [Flavihumibacter sp. ZG627]|uniref:efflux RND transporter periplasmic adaptor subunit n=1 Tax=Flavihumibacter sp. ZG627 TaxID=1463156 RepID=UPI00057EAB4D|nr:efflux RND transporter periplasmic adaptor subunit [Flavihumibacter sp. ZG627]KIC90496.1 hypothetical protein HY58_11115 [Flavihumibacter sp. ZG627]
MKYFFAVCLLVTGLMACRQNEAGEHTHNEDGSHPGEEGLASVSYTLYSDSSELFVEFKPLIVGKTSRFAAHLTMLGESFRPYTEGNITVNLIQGDKGLRNSVDSVASPGIFRLALQPVLPGWGKLVFDISRNGFKDQITIDSIQVYPDEKTAAAAQPAVATGSDISYLKEQAWKTEFANAPVKRQTIYDIVKATGQLVAAPGDEVTIAARSNGIVHFSGSGLVTGTAVKAGQRLFTVTGGEIAFENIAAARQSAQAELSSAKAEYDRAAELIKDQLVTRAEFEAAKLRYEKSRIALRNLSRNYSGGNALTVPIAGFITNIMVSEGQYVTSGQPLATISRNQKLLLKADVSLRDADRIRSVQEANFILAQGKEIYNTRELNGRLVSVGKTTGTNMPFIPVHFEISNKQGLVPGSFAEVHLKTSPIDGSLAIPVTALVEEQGVYYVYVQTGGESFQKREVKTGVSDGRIIQVLSGIKEGERIVTKGAYQIKLSQASGTMPAHGHEH